MATIKRPRRGDPELPESMRSRRAEEDHPLHSLMPDRDLLLAQYRTECGALAYTRLVCRVVCLLVAVGAFALSTHNIYTLAGIAYTGGFFCFLWYGDVVRKVRKIQAIEGALVSDAGRQESFADDYIRFRYFSSIDSPLTTIARVEPMLWLLCITMGSLAGRFSSLGRVS